MKTKRFDKKLVLNKKTIVHLDNGEMKALEAGINHCKTITTPTCGPIPPTWTCNC